MWVGATNIKITNNISKQWEMGKKERKRKKEYTYTFKVHPDPQQLFMVDSTLVISKVNIGSSGLKFNLWIWC